ncbi:MAG: hypothetical protein CSA38_01890 [Flavobacteriales bacterium]|nr:MAG: hypothetical protein CSA38_01890 [Flavobacteriales bacterium]
MNKKFSERLEEYLSNECSDYDLTYKWEWNEHTECCEVEIKRDDYSQNIKHLNFRYDEVKDDLKIELSEDYFYTTREFDYTVKYFWMLVSPALFPVNE